MILLLFYIKYSIVPKKIVASLQISSNASYETISESFNEKMFFSIVFLPFLVITHSNIWYNNIRYQQ